MNLTKKSDNFTILYLEDDENIRINISKTLQYLFKTVLAVKDVDEALKAYSNHSIDIILSDISMPGKNGLDFVKEIREKNRHIPIILLTAHTNTNYLLDATKLKLVNYLTKPVDFNELNQALQQAIEECQEYAPQLIEFSNNITFNPHNKQIIQDNKNMELTNKELKLLEYLIEHKNRAVSKEEIYEYVWEDYFNTSETALKSLLNKLRKKIGKESIKNISGMGYQIHFNF